MKIFKILNLDKWKLKMNLVMSIIKYLGETDVLLFGEECGGGLDSHFYFNKESESGRKNLKKITQN